MNLLAVDPGSYHTGAALFRDGKLSHLWALEATSGVGVERASAIVAKLRDLIYDRVQILVVEKPPPNPKRPAPLIRAIHDSLRSVARSYNLQFASYYPSEYLKKGDIQVVQRWLSQETGQQVTQDQTAAYLLGRHHLEAGHLEERVL